MDSGYEQVREITEAGQKSEEKSTIPEKYSPHLIPEAANLVLQRLIAKKGLCDLKEVISLDIAGALTRVTYVLLISSIRGSHLRAFRSTLGSVP